MEKSLSDPVICFIGTNSALTKYYPTFRIDIVDEVSISGTYNISITLTDNAVNWINSSGLLSAYYLTVTVYNIGGIEAIQRAKWEDHYVDSKWQLASNTIAFDLDGFDEYTFALGFNKDSDGLEVNPLALFSGSTGDYPIFSKIEIQQ